MSKQPSDLPCFHLLLYFPFPSLPLHPLLQSSVLADIPCCWLETCHQLTIVSQLLQTREGKSLHGETGLMSTP